MQINLLEKFDNFKNKLDDGLHETVLKQHRRRKKIFFIAKIAISVFLVIVVLLAAFSYQVISTGQALYDEPTERPSFFSQIKNLITSEEKPLRGEIDQRINILLLGIGGKDHAGPYLTDTIIIASFIPQEKKVAMISIPRDLVVPVKGYGWHKVNRLNAFGEEKMPGNGAKFAAQTFEAVLDLPIHYYGRIDFTGFANIIDQLGGLKIYVENTIDDKYYPILGKEDVFPYLARFERLYLEKGWQKMDGELALKYARSRHTPGVEGSDFARAKRQQKIITALKDKAFSYTTLLNPIKLSGLLNTFQEHISTNMEIWEIVKISKMLGDLNLEEVISYVFDDSPASILYAANLEGAYVLQPKAGDFDEMQSIIKNIFALKDSQTKTASNGRVKLEILNGTKINGLAGQTAEQLREKGYQIIKTGNAPEPNYEKTVIYDLTGGAKPEAVAVLKDLLKANVTASPPAWVRDTWTEFNQEPVEEDTKKIITQADILIVLGLDQKK